jgi:cell division protein FtsQ
MSVTVRDMMGLGSWRRRAGRKTAARVSLRRRPAAPVTRTWEGMTAVLRGALIMASGLVLAGVLGWGWSTLTDPHFLPIKSVQVQGSFTHVNAPAVRAAVIPFLTGNFLTVDVRRVQQIVQTLPWVRHAEVRRVWPDAVHIAITEQVPVAKWGGDALVNDAGEIFSPPRASYPAGLPSLQGPEGSGEVVVAALRDMGGILAPLGLHINRLILDERRAWGLELDNGMQVVLGRGNGYGRLLKFVRFYRRAFHDQAGRVERVDLRYSNGFAVRWKQAGKQK